MKRIYISAIAAAMIPATGILSSCSNNEKKTDSDTEIPRVEVAAPVIDSVTLIKSKPGTLVARDWADVVGRVDGTILKQHFEDGQYVHKGQTLYTIESSKYNDAVRQAKASLETAKSQYDYYSQQYAAMKKAYESDAVSKMDVIQAESNMRQAQASIMNATADLSIANTNLGYCSIKAPLSGYITSGDLKVGAYLTQGATICRIVDNSSFSAEFQVEAGQYEQMLGLSGGLSNHAYRNIPLKFSNPLPHPYTANLTFEAPSVSTTTGTILLKGEVTNPYNELKDGMYVTVDLPYGFNPRAILVKDASLQTDQLGKYLYTVNDSNKVVYTPVKVGAIYRDSLRIVESGLKEGQVYVTNALMAVRPGMKVKPIRK